MDQRLARACEGSSYSRGGLNLNTFRSRLATLYPQYKDYIMSAKRYELTSFCNGNSTILMDISRVRDPYFHENTHLTEEQKKYCRCVMHVSAKNVTNPYAVCTKSVGRDSKINCYPEYDFSNIPTAESNAYLRQEGKMS